MRPSVSIHKTTVVENAPAKIVAVNVGGFGNLMQVVVAAPWSDDDGRRLFLLERPPASYWWAYQWPDVSSAKPGDTVIVCYSNRSSYDAAAVVDIDCDVVKWRAFCSNFMHGAAFLLVMCLAGIFAAHVTSVMVVTFHLTLGRLRAAIDEDDKHDNANLTNPLLLVDIEGGTAMNAYSP